MRDIEHILNFRRDLSPFLTHLTRASKSESAKDTLIKILDSGELVAGGDPVSDARWGLEFAKLKNLDTDEQKRFFNAVCFTETPLDEIHCLLEIGNRDIDLEPYGLVYVREKLQAKCVSPVVYIQNCCGDKNPLFAALCSMIKDYPDEAAIFIPLVSVFGDKLKPAGTHHTPAGEVDFRWEREWRQVFERCPVAFDENNVFVGICPDEEIDYFETKYNYPFVDPRRNMKWYASKLIEARQKHDLKCSVV